MTGAAGGCGWRRLFPVPAAGGSSARWRATWHGQVENGRPFPCDGKSGAVSLRLLHVLELQDGQIRREQAWCDLAAIQRQLGCRLT
jgi:hypothetical protein